MKSVRAELALAGVTVIWGAAFVVVKAVLTDVSPLLFLTLRFALAALCLAIIYRRRLHRGSVLAGIGAGCILFTAFALQTWGLAETTASKSAFLTGLSIPMVPFLNSVVYRIRPRLFEVAGVLIASFGMALMTLPNARFEMSRGDLLSVLCAVCFALHIVVVNHFSRAMGFETLATVQMIAATALGLATFWFAEPVRLRSIPAVAAAVLVTGVLATALAFTVMAWAQQYTSATRSALIFALEPIVAWGTSWILTGETMGARGRLGALLIVAGVLTVEIRNGARQRS